MSRLPDDIKKLSSIQPESPQEAPEKPSKRMRQSTMWQSDECLRQLKALAAERRTTISALVGIGLNHVFYLNGKPQIAVEEPDR